MNTIMNPLPPELAQQLGFLKVLTIIAISATSLTLCLLIEIWYQVRRAGNRLKDLAAIFEQKIPVKWLPGKTPRGDS